MVLLNGKKHQKILQFMLVKLQTEETDGYMFATKEQIEAFAAEGKFLHYDSIKQAFEF